MDSLPTEDSVNFEDFITDPELIEKENVITTEKIKIIVKENYHFERRLGIGSSGCVYFVYKKDTGIGYACKVIPKNKMNDLISMQKEIDIMRRIKHNNIINLIDSYDSPNCIWLILELSSHTNGLRGLLDKVHHFNETTACRLVKQILEAMRYLHREKIIHRDLKIDNILFLGDLDKGSIKISDFGLSACVIDYNLNDSGKRKRFTGLSDRFGTGI